MTQTNRTLSANGAFSQRWGGDYRAPLGRMKLFVIRYPARWAGLRDRGPLARTVMIPRMESPYEIEHRVTAAEMARRASPPALVTLLATIQRSPIREGMMIMVFPSANGAPFLSPGQRPGFADQHTRRPEGPP